MMRNRPFHLAACFIIIIAIAMLAGCAKSPKAVDANRYIREHNLTNLPRFDIPVEVNDRVVAWMEYFQGSGRKHFERYLERSGRYLPQIQEILKKERMPKDLAYIALIESGFNTRARSSANAVGMWQFIRGTGQRYDLKIDGWVDERNDPEKATYAAVGYFRDLYGEFGDWYLAMASYNAGEGKVRRAIATTGSRNFWEIANDKHALRPETRDYVPKFIAAAIMAKMPERFGFGDVNYLDPIDYEVADVDAQTDVNIIAKCAGVDDDIIRELNPHLIRGTTPPGKSSYAIKIPRGTTKVFEQEIAKIPKEERVQLAHYRVRRGDTIQSIAGRFGIDPIVIASANNISPNRKLKKGTMIVVPGGAAAMRAVADADAKETASSATKIVRYKVKAGETLAKIANKNGVTIAQLRNWNDLSKKANIRPGQTLRVYKKLPTVTSKDKSKKLNDTTAVALADLDKSDDVSAAAASSLRSKHKLAKGETIGQIAAKYGMTTKELMSLNKIKNPKSVRAGTTLMINDKKNSARPQPQQPVVKQEPKHGPVSSMTPAKPTEAANQSLADMNLPALRDTTAVKLAAPSTPSIPTVYEVKDGETLWEIARKNKVTIAEIQKWNNLKDPSSVKPGTKINIKKKK